MAHKLDPMDLKQIISLHLTCYICLDTKLRMIL